MAVNCRVYKYTTKAGSRYRVKLNNRRLRHLRTRFEQSGFSTKREAEAFARKTEHIIASLETGDIEVGRTLGELSEWWLKNKLPEYNESDRKAHPGKVACWIEIFGADTQLATITPKKVSEALTTLRSKRIQKPLRGRKPGKGTATLSAASVNRYRALLQALLTCAVKDLHWMVENPVQKTHMEKEPEGRERYLEQTEVAELLEAVDAQDDPHCPLIVRLGLFTGMRQGEILKLRWDWVKLEGDNPFLLLPTGETKNRSAKHVPLVDPHTVGLLRMHKLRYQRDSEMVFPPLRAGKYYTLWRSAFNKALEEAGIKGFRFHDLRHTFASYLAMEGVDGLAIADLTGHKTMKMVKRYAHLNPGTRAKTSAKAAARIRGDKADE